jgi:hypothetical protein
MLNDDDRRQEVIALWLEHYPPNKRTIQNVMPFYGWLCQHCPELLNARKSDPCQYLKFELRAHLEGDFPPSLRELQPKAT